MAPRTRRVRPRIAVAGRNCWRVERAARVAFLVDGADYFRAVTQAMAETRRTILMSCWDVDSRTRLPWHGRARLRVALARLLGTLVERMPALEVRILAWRRSLFFASDREWFPERTWRNLPGRRTDSPRLRFHADGLHPLGACHHQKYIVLDDRVAFSGGMDLTKGRWDTPGHRLEDPRRQDFRGRVYLPFHDVQVVVAGPPATSLGEMFRERWRLVTGERLPPLATAGPAPWPPDVEPWMRDVRVAIARSSPAYGPLRARDEVHRLYRDAIAAARRSIYLENQYFTHAGIADALAARLREPAGPEVVLVVPRGYQGRFERLAFGPLRACLIRRLRDADVHARLTVRYPRLRGEGAGRSLKVHSKLMIVDDAFVQIGSSNLSRRSMAVDTECDLAIEAGDDREARAAVRRLREMLLAEHLDTTPGAVAQVYARRGSLIEVVTTLARRERRLAPAAAAAATTPPPLARALARIVDPPCATRCTRQGLMRRSLAALLLSGGALLTALYGLG